MRIGTKSPLNCVVVQAGWFGLFTPWALVHHHLPVGCEVRLLRHPALPLVHQLSLVSPLDLLHDVLCILISAMQIICWEEAPWITSLQLLLSSLMRGLGRHLGEISSSSWGKETDSLLVIWSGVAWSSLVWCGVVRCGLVPLEMIYLNFVPWVWSLERLRWRAKFNSFCVIYTSLYSIQTLFTLWHKFKKQHEEGHK